MFTSGKIWLIIIIVIVTAYVLYQFYMAWFRPQAMRQKYYQQSVTLAKLFRFQAKPLDQSNNAWFLWYVRLPATIVLILWIVFLSSFMLTNP